MNVATMDNSIRGEMTVKADRAKVWAALTDPALFGQWFCSGVEGTVSPGEMVKFNFAGTDGSCGGSSTVRIEQLDEPTTYAWRWHPGGSPDWGEAPNEETTLVTFTLEEVDGGTRVVVVESGFEGVPDARRLDVFQMNTKGWEYQLEVLGKFLA